MSTRPDADAESARAFLSSRGFVLKVWKESSDVWVALNTHAQSVAERYGHGATEQEAMMSAAQRYRVEEADWDQSAIRIDLEYVPTSTTSGAVRSMVDRNFTTEGLHVQDFSRLKHQLDAERLHPGPGYHTGFAIAEVHLANGNVCMPVKSNVLTWFQLSVPPWRFRGH